MVQRLRGAVHGIGAKARSVIDTMERGALARVDAHEPGRRLAKVEANRQSAVGTLAEISALGSTATTPGDEATHPHLEVADRTVDPQEYASAAQAAISAVVDGLKKGNDEAVGEFEESTSSLLGLLAESVAEYVGEVRSNLQRAAGEVATKIGEVAGRITETAGAGIASVISGMGDYIRRIGSALRPIVDVTLEIVRAPVNAIGSVGRSIIDGIGGFVRRIVSKIASLVTGGSHDEDTSALTAPLEAFTPSRLAAAARMASPPAAAAAVVIGIPCPDHRGPDRGLPGGPREDCRDHPDRPWGSCTCCTS